MITNASRGHSVDAMARRQASPYTSGAILAIALVSLAGCGNDESVEPAGNIGGGWPFGIDRHVQTIGFPAGIGGVSPRFSPDGTQIAYARGNGTVFDLAVMTAAGTDSRTLTSDGNKFLSMAWTADGSQLIYGSTDTGVRTAQLAGGASQLLIDGSATLNPDVSPDGRWLVYSSDRLLLQLADLSQNPPVVSDLAVSGDSPRFSPDGRTLALLRFPKIQLLDLASGTLNDVIDTDNPLGRVDWFPDGAHLLAGTEKGIEILTLGSPVRRWTIRGGSSSHTNIRDVDLSPDGTKVAYTREGESKVFVLTGL